MPGNSICINNIIINSDKKIAAETIISNLSGKGNDFGPKALLYFTAITFLILTTYYIELYYLLILFPKSLFYIKILFIQLPLLYR